MTIEPRSSDSQLQALMDTVERLRRDHFPQIDESLVREVLSLHADAAATPAELGRRVEQAVERRLTKE